MPWEPRGSHWRYFQRRESLFAKLVPYLPGTVALQDAAAGAPGAVKCLVFESAHFD
jgi:hypothetical protein